MGLIGREDEATVLQSVKCAINEIHECIKQV